MSAEHVLRNSSTQNDTERKLRMRLGGLHKAVGEMEPGQREFCLAAIDEWLDYMAGLRDQNDALRATLEKIASWRPPSRTMAENEIARQALKELGEK